nr:MAG TPA: hypothetical protein [Inoviridae sp.]
MEVKTGKISSRHSVLGIKNLLNKRYKNHLMDSISLVG